VGKYLLIEILLVAFPAFVAGQKPVSENVTFRPDTSNHKVEVLIGGKLFTNLIYTSDLEKPILYPLFTSDGIEITRGFPISPRPGERVDHPHQVGCWFNYGSVNGLDFWNNSYAIPEKDKATYGSIKHVRILKMLPGNEGRLVYSCQWTDHSGNILLNEETTLQFSGQGSTVKFIRTTTLSAVNGDVTFADNKEGLFALRVDRAFETPSQTPEIYTDASGKATTVPVLNNEGVNGVYRSSEGKEKDAVWGSRAKWVSLSATKQGEQITICMFDHPLNPDFPACWHARGYGLFSVNDIGRNAYDPGQAVNILIIKKGHSTTFRHELWIVSDKEITASDINDEFASFSNQ
jgi:hypothetical protein